MTNHPIALSVLIPNYNYARYIGETIDSVLSQAPPDLEIIVTDNASTDKSADVVREYADPRVRRLRGQLRSAYYGAPGVFPGECNARPMFRARRDFEAQWRLR